MLNKSILLYYIYVTKAKLKDGVVGRKAVNTMEREEIPLNKREIKVLAVLREYKAKGGVDTFKLSEATKNTRPSNEIVTLRKKGYNIRTITCKNENTGKTYYKYLLVGEPMVNPRDSKEEIFFEQLVMGVC